MYLKHALSPLPFPGYEFLILKMMNIRTAVLSQNICIAIVRVQPYRVYPLEASKLVTRTAFTFFHLFQVVSELLLQTIRIYFDSKAAGSAACSLEQSCRILP